MRDYRDLELAVLVAKQRRHAATTSRPRRRRCAFCAMPIAALVIRIGPDRTGVPTYKRPNQRVYRFGSSKRPLVQLNRLKPVEPTGFL